MNPRPSPKVESESGLTLFTPQTFADCWGPMWETVNPDGSAARLCRFRMDDLRDRLMHRSVIVLRQLDLALFRYWPAFGTKALPC